MAMPGIGNVVGGWAAGKVADMVDPNWVTQEEAQAAQKRVDQAHQDAIQQMAKLGQSYDQSVTRLNSAQPPEFPAVPGAERRQDGQNVEVGGSTGGGGGTGGSGHGTDAHVDAAVRPPDGAHDAAGPPGADRARPGAHHAVPVHRPDAEHRHRPRTDDADLADPAGR
ncbi:hypothetical protein ACFQ1I_17520 [Kitasatospora arboriphila]